ncbi:MAG TPA: hypothetical protein VFU53_08910 [Burkholderiales bacterium]|nr:hypothetical protein [Burkholderiales bacterium]
MSDRETLLRWLNAVAARVGWSRRMPELARLACALIALWLLAEVLTALGLPAPVRSALTPLLVLCAVGAAALSAWRLARPTTLAQAAEAVDMRAGLKDQLKSAHWFAQRPARDALVELLLTRAAGTAQRLDARGLFPLSVPRSALAALVLAIVTGALAWFSPRIALPIVRDPDSAPVAVNNKPVERSVRRNDVEQTAAETAPPDSARTNDPSTIWSQLERMAQQLPAGAEVEAIGRAVTARDAPLTERLLQALRREQAAGAEPGARSREEQLTTELAQGMFERLQEIFEKEGTPRREPSMRPIEEPTARITQEVQAQSREEKRKIKGTPAQGEIQFNPRMRALTRRSAASQELAQGAGEAAEAGSQTSVEGDAKGTPEGKSRSGGTSGEHPESSASATDSQPVLGDQAVRLEVQLREVRVERTDDPQLQATEESFYAATQRQAAQVQYEGIAAQWRRQREATVPPSSAPFSYREAVKRYFLTQHGREE